MGGGGGGVVVFLIFAVGLRVVFAIIRSRQNGERERQLEELLEHERQREREREYDRALAPPKKKKKKKKKKPEETAETAPTGETVSDMLKSEEFKASLEAMSKGAAAKDGLRRQHHVMFAHHVLRPWALNRAHFDELDEAVTAGDAMRVVGPLWAEAGQMGLAMGDKERLKELPLVTRISDLPHAILVTMPLARGMTEAHFIAIVLAGDAVRYFCLEESIRSALLCEWKETAHANLGKSLEPTTEDFIAAVREQLAD